MHINTKLLYIFILIGPLLSCGLNQKSNDAYESETTRFSVKYETIHPLTFYDSQQLLSLLQNEKFTQLEEKLKHYFDLFTENLANEPYVDQALETFDTDRPWMDEKIKLWIKASPDSHFPLLIYALHNNAIGWNSRGKDTIDKTTKKQISKMQFHLDIAKRYFEKSLEIERNNVHAYAYLVNIAMSDSDKTALNDYYANGLRINPLSHRLHMFYSFSLRPRWGGSIKAIEQFVKNIGTLSKDNPRLRSLAGLLLAEKGDKKLFRKKYHKAIRYYEEAEAYGDFWYLYNNMAAAYFELREFEQSSLYYKKVAKIRPMYTNALYKLALAQNSLRKNDDAINYIEMAKKIDGPKYKYYSVCSYLYLNSRDYEKAKYNVTKALEIRPNNKNLRKISGIIDMNIKRL